MNKLSGRSGMVLASAAAMGLVGIVPSALAETVPAAVVSSNSACRAETPTFSLAEFSCHYDSVLGTSMDLLVLADNQRQADLTEAAVLGEIDRLCGILSTYRADSEISRWIAGETKAPSSELAQMLSAYDLWKVRTAGAIDINMAAVKALWEDAAQSSRMPSERELAAARETTGALNVDALGKGYVIDQAVAVARRMVPAGLLNIGGDLRAWGPARFTIHLADPFNPAENAPHVGVVELADAAIATSGDYARLVTIAGRRFSHVIDPRTSRPAHGVASASVVAADCLTANALSTAACVAGNDVSDLLADYANGFLVIDTSGEAKSGGNVSTPAPVLAAQALAARPLAADAGNWPKDFQVTVNLDLKLPQGGRYKRPYVAVWVEDENGKAVRTISLIGNRDKYIREMTGWWKATGGDRNLARLGKATRDPGKFSLVWDGMDDKGKPLPKGKYTVMIEVNREHGRHVTEPVKIECGDTKADGKTQANAEAEVCTVVYGPKDPKAK